MDRPTPRVNMGNISQYVNETVRVVGRILPIKQTDVALLESSDQGQITIHKASGTVYESEYVEIIGIVNSDLTVRELTYTNLGNNFNLPQYNEVILLSSQAKGLFV